MLLLKYFVIIKKGEIVAPWINFDDYKVFEGITNDFGLKKDLLYFRDKIIILSDLIRKPQEQEQKMCNLLEVISIFLKVHFVRKSGLYFWVDPMTQLMAKRAERHAKFLAGTLCESTPWVDPLAWVDPMSRPLLLCRLKL